MAFRDDLLSELDSIRAIPGDLGLHRFSVYVRTVTWSGTRVGLGTRASNDVQLLVSGENPHVKQIKQHDVVAGDDAMQFAQYDIGPLTPEFGGGGESQDVLNPQHNGTPTEVFYVLKGPNLPVSGLLCMRTDDDPTRPFRYMVRVKSTGKAA